MKDREKEELFYHLFRESKQKIYRLCYAYLSDKNETDDLFQEVMINVWNNLEKFRGDAKISTWVYRIAVNTAFMYNRKTKRNNELFLRYSPDTKSAETDQQTHSHEETDQLIAKLHQSIQSLNKQERIIISLLLEGLKYNEIADITGLTTNHIGVKINRIKPVLFKQLEEVKNG